MTSILHTSTARIGKSMSGKCAMIETWHIISLVNKHSGVSPVSNLSDIGILGELLTLIVLGLSKEYRVVRSVRFFFFFYFFFFNKLKILHYVEEN